jgi:PAS domain S-box-containing protein
MTGICKSFATVYNADVADLAKSLTGDAQAEKKTLRFLEGMFTFFVNHALAVITVIDKTGIIVYQSPSIKTILGYDYRKRIRHNFLHSQLVHPDDVVIKEQLFKKALRHPNENFKDELRMRHKNGSWSWMEVSFNNQLNNKFIRGIVVVTHDITERKIMELQKDEFLSIASHELKTPLTVIRAYSQLLKTKIIQVNENDEKITFLNKIVLQTDKITLLIDELLDMGKIQEGKFTVRTKPFDVSLLIEKIIADFRYVSNSHIIVFHDRIRTMVQGDADRIAQVFTNLLTNAIKYSPGSDKVVVRTARSGENIITSVTDYGIGIPAGKQKYIFQRFFRIEDNSPAQLSSGLGLYIAAEIIKLHKGKIWFESKKGQGTTFYFSLPAYDKN